MSLESDGVFADLLVTGSSGFFSTSEGVSAEKGVPHIESHRKLFRKLLEVYLNSDQFVKDTYELQSTVVIKIDSCTNLVMNKF